jgi:hypothetical protein
MNPQEMKSIRVATGQIEKAMETFEGILAESDYAALFRSCSALMEALQNLHTLDAGLVSPANRERIENQQSRNRKQPGRDTFTTGF